MSSVLLSIYESVGSDAVSEASTDGDDNHVL